MKTAGTSWDSVNSLQITNCHICELAAYRLESARIFGQPDEQSGRVRHAVKTKIFNPGDPRGNTACSSMLVRGLWEPVRAGPWPLGASPCWSLTSDGFAVFF